MFYGCLLNVLSGTHLHIEAKYLSLLMIACVWLQLEGFAAALLFH